MFLTIRAGKKLLARKVKICDTIFSRTLGLMFHQKLNSSEGIILVAKQESKLQTGIHSFFVFFPFDVLWINENKVIVDKKSVKPFQAFIHSKFPAKYVLELNKGATEAIAIGTKIEF